MCVFTGCSGGYAEEIPAEKIEEREKELEELRRATQSVTNYGSVCVQPVCMEEVPGISVDPGFGCVLNALSEFQALLNDVCQGGFVNISEKVSEVTIIQNTRPKTAEESNTGESTGDVMMHDIINCL
ncbi:hypothetical protein Baya_10676 [Bagarius yarrelli]|uniref:Uncharacterized protein n=1 Tax=Bagarius yarrelli TaxID=175774 RepID=A0A556UG51_BAGYA|nr:hypothetical protein Baya_10676 [Bagarius yarrelli]